MSESVKNPSPFDLLVEQIRAVVREEISTALNSRSTQLLTPEELAEKLGLRNDQGEPLTSWVYEQSRLGNIPTHRIGRYIRFDLMEVLESQKQKESISPLTRVK
jgi:hypothetical protein